ncbi:MAG: cell division protein FtsL [Arsenophonus sp.]|nr:cell division protein FtsL [Arsenophonus sp.]
MIIVEKYNLIRIISYDIFRHGFIQMILLIVIIISAISIITVSYETRLLTAQKDLITEENDLLDIEWRNLILEEISLGNHNRIERLAIDKLHMIHVNPMQEHILIAK